MTRRDPFAIFGRLRRQTLDEDRLALAAAEREVTGLEAVLAELRARRGDEIARPFDHPDLLGRYLGRVRQEEGRVVAALREAADARDAQALRVNAARLSVRQIERLAALREQRDARERARREQRRLDDLGRSRLTLATGRGRS